MKTVQSVSTCTVVLLHGSQPHNYTTLVSGHKSEYLLFQDVVLEIRGKVVAMQAIQHYLMSLSKMFIMFSIASTGACGLVDSVIVLTAGVRLSVYSPVGVRNALPNRCGILHELPPIVPLTDRDHVPYQISISIIMTWTTCL